MAHIKQKKFLFKKAKEEEEETQSFLSPQKRGHVSTQGGGHLEAKRRGLRMKPTLPAP